MNNPQAGIAPVPPAPPAPDQDRLNRTIATELVPQLLVSHRTDAPPPELLRTVGEQLSDEEIEEFVRLVRGRDEESVDAFVQDMVESGRSPESLYLDLLAPAARRLGVLWEDDRCDFVEVTIGVGRMQRVLRSLSYLFTLPAATTDPVGRALLACAPGEQHSLGLFIVAEFFVKAGWNVEVGAPLEQADITARARDEWFDLVGFSVGCESRLTAVRRQVQSVRRASRNPRIRALVGGRVFNEHPELVRKVGADGSASSAREAPQVARELVSA
jgi:methanogenic corrinoid protein MtbC1